MLGTRAELKSETIKTMANCRLIVRYGAGVDNIDIHQATRQGILVANVPDYCVDEVSDHALAMLLAANRRLLQANQETLAGGWGTGVMQGAARLSRQSVGIVGFGRVGQEMARKVRPLVLDVMAYDPVVAPWLMEEAGVRAVDFSTLLAASDYISIHCPLTADTRHLFDRDALEKMKPSAWLINTARGEIVDEQALLDGLRQGEIAGAALDVFAQEPPDSQSPLLSMSNVLLTPHVAFYSIHAIEDLQRHAAEQVRAILSGSTPRWVMNQKNISKDNAT
jgi:D-3-phosphoglycerate dehydrogenase